MVKFKTKIGDIRRRNKISIEESAPKHLYLRDYYIKDFKYISPEMVKMRRGKDRILKGSVKQKVPLVEKWLTEVMKGLEQFFYQGSLHGVKYIFEPTFGRKEKAAWIVIMAISIAICAVNIIQLFLKWTSTPFVNVIDSLPTPIWAIPFPTVVICPHLHVKMSYANVSQVDGLEQFFASLVCPRMNGKIEPVAERLDLEQINLFQEFLLKSSPHCRNVVKACNWPPKHKEKWETAKCCELFRPIFTNYGLCFAFNSIPLNGMTNDTLSWQKSFNHKSTATSLQWGLDTGYPKTFPPDPNIEPFRVMASGEANGLSLELYLNTSEHQYACDGKSLGFTILIRSPTDHAYSSTVLRVPMDRMTTVEVSPITYKTDSSLRSLAPNKRQCYFQNEKRLEYYDFYTDSNCQHDLFIQEANKTCKCVLYNWPRKNTWESICSTHSDFECIIGVNAKVEKQLIYAYYEESEEQTEPREESKSCHPSCNDIIYSSQVFYSDLTSELGDIGKRDASPQWGKPKQGEVTQINVHFYEDFFLGQHRHAQYDDYYFAGAIGGLLSLFLGFSIISVAELVYFVFLRPAYGVFQEAYGQHHRVTN